MAIVMSMAELMDSYTKGRGWRWQECDCIGLLFHCVNYCAPKPQLRADYVPTSLSYNQAVLWLGNKYLTPTDPYITMLCEAGLTQLDDGSASVSIVYGGPPLVAADGEEYPVSVVPGVVFTTSSCEAYALMLGGLRRVNLHRHKDRTITRFFLKGIK